MMGKSTKVQSGREGQYSVNAGNNGGNDYNT